MTAGRSRRFRAILFDVDGTLVDSNLLHAMAWADAFREAGIDAPDVERIRRLIGMGGDKLLPTAVHVDPDSPLGKRLSERRGEIFLERYLDQVHPFPGTARLVETLRDRGFRLGVASSAKPEELRALLERAGVPWLADRAASAEEAGASKPDPDVVEAALGKVGTGAAETVLIGDTPYDVEAGRRAGVAVIGFRCGGWSDPDLAGAIAIYDGPADLLEHLDSSPLGPGMPVQSGTRP